MGVLAAASELFLTFSLAEVAAWDAGRVAQGSATSSFPLPLWKGKVLALRGSVFLVPGKGVRMMCDCVHYPRDAMA